MWCSRLILVCLVLYAARSTAEPAAVTAPSDAEIQRILVDRIDVQKRSVGVVVGVIEPRGHRVIAYGNLEKGDNRRLDGDSIFEIGSITKVFTALVAAEMAQSGELKLDDPIATYLPASVKMPERKGRQVTIADLATHTSGLPRMPANFRPKDPENPYADYSVDALYAFLSSYQLHHDVGVKFEYSNLGFGLLGIGLAQRAGMGYEKLVVTRICDPLGMSSTRITLSGPMRHRLAVGHSADLVKVSPWDIPTLAGAGALRSSANDLLAFLAGVMGYSDSPRAAALAAAQKLALSISRPTGEPFIDAGLGWTIDTRGGGEIVWKNGGTGGYRTFIGYSPRTGVGVVALSNAATEDGVDDLGLNLLDPRYPLSVPEGSPNEIAVDAKALDGYVGNYELSANFILTVTREGDQLFVKATSQPRAAVYPTSRVEFFYKVVDAQITFEPGEGGLAAVLVLHQNGLDQRAQRIDDAEAKKLSDYVAQHFKDQKANPGSEASIRRQIEELQRRQPDLGAFTPALAEIARPQMPHAEDLIASFGSLKLLDFKGVGPGGADIYTANFERGSLEWRIFLDADGKIAFQFFRPAP
jgi:D-alanyl-D-alanine-carboxypeptidase/D-alanyl-D-alanine-endopeptidase